MGDSWPGRPRLGSLRMCPTGGWIWGDLLKVPLPSLLEGRHKGVRS